MSASFLIPDQHRSVAQSKSQSFTLRNAAFNVSLTLDLHQIRKLSISRKLCRFSDVHIWNLDHGAYQMERHGMNFIIADKGICYILKQIPEIDRCSDFSFQVSSLCFHICSCWYLSWNTNWKNHENKFRRAVNYILQCHGLHIWSWHDQSIKMLDGKTKWRESEPDEKGGSLFINQTESGRSFPLAGSMEGVALHSLWPSLRAKRAKLSTATMAAIHSLDHGGASEAALHESGAC